MVKAVHLGDRLHYSCEELLRTLVPETAARRRRNTVWEWKRYGIIWMSSVDSPRVGRSRGVDHVIDRIQRERDIVGDPKNPVASANQRLRSQAIRQPDAGREAVFCKRQVAPGAGWQQKDVAHHGWRSCG